MEREQSQEPGQALPHPRCVEHIPAGRLLQPQLTSRSQRMTRSPELHEGPGRIREEEIGQQEAWSRPFKATTAVAKEKATNTLAILHSRFGLYDQALTESIDQILRKGRIRARAGERRQHLFMRGQLRQGPGVLQQGVEEGAQKSDGAPVRRAGPIMRSKIIPLQRKPMPICRPSHRIWQRSSPTSTSGARRRHRAANVSGLQKVVVWQESNQ